MSKFTVGFHPTNKDSPIFMGDELGGVWLTVEEAAELSRDLSRVVNQAHSYVGWLGGGAPSD